MTTNENIVFSLIQTDNGGEFASQHGWSLQDSVCSWYGVDCDSQGREVLRISLTDANLDSTLPSQLGQLSELQSLVLSNCKLHGTIPLELTTLPKLRTIDLTFNSLTGTIPTFPSSLFLRELLLEDNRLSGPIPPFGGMPNLATLSFKLNELEGTIPDLLELPHLTRLDLSSNGLEGSLPSNYPQNLEALYLEHNNLSGSIPEGISDALSLREIVWTDNQLTGTVPTAIGQLGLLKVFFIDGNRITGEIPSRLCVMPLNDGTSATTPNEFELEEDKSSSDGSISNSFHRNGCESIACPSGTYGLNGVFPCRTCENAYLNPYLGASKCIHISEETILDIFYDATHGDGWTGIKRGWKDPAIPICRRDGIVCDEDSSSVLRLKLQDKNLLGTLPLQLGFLPNLIELDVSHNKITGHLPEELSLAPLQRLDISENQISGFVPGSLCRKEGVNGNGENGVFDCDIIACPMRTYHPNGHMTPGTNDDIDNNCQPCNLVDGLVLGNTNCGLPLQEEEQTGPLMTARQIDILIVSALFLVFFLIGGLLWRYLGFLTEVQRRYRKCSMPEESRINTSEHGKDQQVERTEVA